MRDVQAIDAERRTVAFFAERWAMSREEILAEPAWLIHRATDAIAASRETAESKSPPRQVEAVPPDLLSGMQGIG